MTKIGHQITGLCSALGVLTFHQHLDHAWLVALGIWLGCTAPDWLEIAWYDRQRNRRMSIIEHRTITHWPPIWIALLAYSWLEAQDNHWFMVLAGFSLGGLIHLLVDWPNPTGIPVLTPRRRSRVSLNLWRSGENEIAIVLVFLLAVLGLYSYNFDVNFFGINLKPV